MVQYLEVFYDLSEDFEKMFYKFWTGFHGQCLYCQRVKLTELNFVQVWILLRQTLQQNLEVGEADCLDSVKGEGGKNLERKFEMKWFKAGVLLLQIKYFAEKIEHCNAGSLNLVTLT